MADYKHIAQSKKVFLVLMKNAKRGRTYDYNGQENGTIKVYPELVPYSLKFSNKPIEHKLDEVVIAQIIS